MTEFLLKFALWYLLEGVLVAAISTVPGVLMLHGCVAPIRSVRGFLAIMAGWIVFVPLWYWNTWGRR